MHNPFYVIRTVFFAVLMYIHALIILFASWNVVAAKDSETPTPGASVFLLLNSLLIFVLVPIAYLSELICTNPWAAQVRVECTWTVLMSILQLAASICMTVDGPPIHCLAQSSWAICASFSLLVHLTWLASFTTFSYCLTICITSSTHVLQFPDVWITPVSRVPWFRLDGESSIPAGNIHQPVRKYTHNPPMSSTWSDTSCALSRYIAERWEKMPHTERQSVQPSPLSAKPCQSADSGQLSLSRQHGTRRGVDCPFARPLPRRKAPPPVALVPPPKSYSGRALSFRSEEDTERTMGTCSDLTLTP